MKKVFYEKVGRRYVPVREYDSDFLDAFPKGTHIIMSYPGGQSTRYNIDPAYGPMIAAGRVAEDVMCRAMVKASELKPSKQPITEEQRAAWENLARTFGQEMYTLNGTSVSDIVQAGVEAMQKEADKLLSNPVVRKSYERFLMIAALTANEQSTEKE